MTNRPNFQDPGVVMNGDKRIPVDTDEAYDAVIALAKHEYERDNGPTWDADMLQQTTKRVVDGLTVEQILAATRKDRGRLTNVPGA